MLSRTRKFFPSRNGISKKLPPPTEYILKDFVPGITPDEEAPMALPRTCDPGPGSWTLAGGDANDFSISGGKFTIADPGLVWTGITPPVVNRGIGIGCFSDTKWISGSLCTAYNTVTRAGPIDVYSWVLNGNADNCYLNLGGVLVLCPSWRHDLGEEYQVGIVFRSNGAFFVYREAGTATPWKLEWVSDYRSDVPLYWDIWSYRGNRSTSNVKILDLPENRHKIWATDFGIATDRVAVPSTGETVLSESNAIVELTWDCATGETVDIMVRRTDDDHCWIVRCDETTNTVKLIENNDGETERGSTGYTFNNGTSYRIIAHISEDVIKTYIVIPVTPTAPTATASYTSATYNQTVGGVKVTGFASGTELVAWPRDIHRHLGSL
jgi:hypothetical protein